MNLHVDLKYRQWSLAFFTTFIFLICGSIVIIANGIYSIKNENQSILNTAVAEIDSILYSSQNTIYDTMPLVGLSCDDLKQKLIGIIVKKPSFESINISKSSEIICSTYDRLIHTTNIDASYPNNELILVKSKVINSGGAIGVIKESFNNYEVSVGIDVSAFFSSLYLINPDIDFKVEALGKWTDRSGDIYSSYYENNLSSKSSKYNYKVSTYISLNNYLSGIMLGYGWHFILLIFIAVFVWYFSYKKSAEKVMALLMKNSLEKKHFKPYAQPIMNSKGELKGLEILIRWEHKKYGIIPPDMFIPLAEKTGLIIPMTRQLITDTIQNLEYSYCHFPKDFHIGVNICTQHCKLINQISLLASCQEFMDSQISKQAYLTLELTERGLIDDIDEAKILFERLQHMGIKLAVDDFGTGNASLSILSNLDFDFIKIDKSFIDLIDVNTENSPIVDNVIDLAKRLNSGLIAEGVEKQVQIDYLKIKGVDYIQGYYYGKPIQLKLFIDEYLGKYKRE
ncbi:EAL domain-containing protein [Shewanella baltica]|uniref:EAL domain-containing protein n=1 Tax=Shewanella baltica TaxID=62322 RepID=UPI00217D86FB|nr:EAL domain-containing protein [Shewanella baltica]MCS6125540.1 EAL domain-containing protein [Shewanella baltica]MCS6237948.1 EAL domain-containing protein [Shewanella baltica]MCS6262099.1 EAL domain-containing protein [Shewanella baltica]MCS6272644.1 EAL domain-containing protein [Shewanella baltica]